MPVIDRRNEALPIIRDSEAVPNRLGLPAHVPKRSAPCTLTLAISIGGVEVSRLVKANRDATGGQIRELAPKKKKTHAASKPMS